MGVQREERLQGIEPQNVLDLLSFQLGCCEEGAISSLNYNATLILHAIG